MLGTPNPSLLIAAQVGPIGIASRIGYDTPSVWLYYLTIFSTVAGAIAGQAAERTRALWLRGDWSREVLFTQVERSFWRHNSYVLGSLLLLMVGIGSYAGFSVTLLAAGLTSVVGIQALVILGGTLKLIPLTGVTLPLLSYGGSSVLANYVLLGLLLAVSAEPRRLHDAA